MSKVKFIGCFFACAHLSACSALGIVGPSANSGQIEYRIAEPTPVTRSLIDAKATDSPLAPGRLIRRYSGTSDAFNSLVSNDAEKDVFSISLEQAIIGRFVGEQRFAQPAEVAILANAFEFDSGDVSEASSRFYEFPEINGSNTDANGKTNPAREGLKLIYFSPDVYLQQPLNFSSLPVIPPSKYNGRPIGIQIVFLELDRLSGPLKSLLRGLADLGQASNTANPIPGVGNVALELGSSLLDGNTNNDDIIFEYRMVLYPRHLTSSSDGGASVNEAATFQPGRYVLRRVESRSQQVRWENLRLDHNTGRLFLRGEADNWAEHREDTYVVLNISKHPAGTPEASYAFQSLNDLDQALDAAAKTDGSESLKVLTENIAIRVAQTRSRAWLGGVDARWGQLRSALDDFNLHRYPGSDEKARLAEGATCTLAPIEPIRTHFIETRLKVRQAAVSFVQEYKRANEAKIEEGENISQFSASDRASLIQRLALFAIPKNEVLAENFATTDSFESAYINGKDGSELSEALLAAIQNTPKIFSCADLVSRGWLQGDIQRSGS